MAKQTINIGITGNDGSGDSIRRAFSLINDNFTEVYNGLNGGDGIFFKNLTDTPKTLLVSTPIAPVLLTTDYTGSTVTQHTLVGTGGITINSLSNGNIVIGATTATFTTKLSDDQNPKLSFTLNGNGFRADNFVNGSSPTNGELITWSYLNTFTQAKSYTLWVNNVDGTNVGYFYTATIAVTTTPTIVARDSVGDIYANNFHGTATSAISALNALALWNADALAFQPAHSINASSSIVARNSYGDISATKIILDGDSSTGGAAYFGNPTDTVGQNRAVFVKVSNPNPGAAAMATIWAQSDTGMIELNSQSSGYTGTPGMGGIYNVSANGMYLWNNAGDIQFRLNSYSSGAIPVASVSTNGITITGGLTLTASSITKNDVNGVGDIGQSGNTFGNVYATTFHGIATSAMYADLAELYLADTTYEPGTVLVFGGAAEVTVSSTIMDRKIAGVVSTKPAHLMNSGLENGTAVALTGRCPCKVIGTIHKGDMLVNSSVAGVAMAFADPKVGSVIGKSLENYDSSEIGIIEVVIGKV